MNWAAEFLPSPPVSGTIPEAHFDSDGQEKEFWIWARFASPESEESWAGCFRGGSFSFSGLVMVPDSADALVVAGGQGYWVSLLDRGLRYQHRFIAAAAPVPGQRTVVVADHVCVALLSVNGLVWETRRVSLDGITFKEVSETLVVGEAAVPGGVAPFEVDIASGEARGGWDES